MNTTSSTQTLQRGNLAAATTTHLAAPAGTAARSGNANGHGTTAARGAEVHIRGLSKQYGGRPVLEKVDLHIPAGAFVAIVGRSGCGKSTLLRLLAGLEQADSGTITLDGQPGAAHGGALRIMFQDARLLPWKRVLDNVALGLNPEPGQPSPRERAQQALAAVGLADRGGEWPAVLSGGQRQRVALARALVHRPRLLLLDEPLGALDALTRIEMQGLIERLWREQGFTAVLVTHDVAEAVALGDRVLLVEDHHIPLDAAIPLPRPRSRGQAAFAAHEELILNRVLQRPDTAAADPLPQPAHGLRWAV